MLFRCAVAACVILLPALAEAACFPKARSGQTVTLSSVVRKNDGGWQIYTKKCPDMNINISKSRGNAGPSTCRAGKTITVLGEYWRCAGDEDLFVFGCSRGEESLFADTATCK